MSSTFPTLVFEVVLSAITGFALARCDYHQT